MKPNELRIGNIVKRGSYFSVERKFNNHVREEFNEANVIVNIKGEYKKKTFNTNKELIDFITPRKKPSTDS